LPEEILAEEKNANKTQTEKLINLSFRSSFKIFDGRKFQYMSFDDINMLSSKDNKLNDLKPASFQYAFNGYNFKELKLIKN